MNSGFSSSRRSLHSPDSNPPGATRPNALTARMKNNSFPPDARPRRRRPDRHRRPRTSAGRLWLHLADGPGTRHGRLGSPAYRRPTGHDLRLGKDGKVRDDCFSIFAPGWPSCARGFDERGLLGLALHPKFKKQSQVLRLSTAPLARRGPARWDHTAHVSEFK